MNRIEEDSVRRRELTDELGRRREVEHEAAERRDALEVVQDRLKRYTR